MIEYVFRCPECADEYTISARDFDYWGAPFCDGEPFDPHERVTMKRHYTVPTVVWPKAERGH